MVERESQEETVTRRTFILRYSGFTYCDEQPPWFLTLEELLPDGSVNEFEADDVYRGFEAVLADDCISSLMGHSELTPAEMRNRARCKRRMLDVVRKIASVESDQKFWVISSRDVAALSSGKSKKRRIVRQKRDVFLETAAAMDSYYADRNRKIEEYRQRIKKPHGTPACYARGCRRAECRAAFSRYSRERMAARKNGDNRGVVSGDAVRAHLARVAEAGGSLNVLSRLTGLTHSYLHGIKTGWRKNIRAHYASAILSWTPETVAAEKRIQAKPARLHVQGLLEHGATLTQIAESGGIEPARLDEVVAGCPYIPTWLAQAILALPSDNLPAA